MENLTKVNNNEFQISNEDLKSYILKDIERCKEYEKNYTNLGIDVIDEGLIEWVMEHFIEDNNLDYDTEWASYVKRGCELFDIEYEGHTYIFSKEEKEKTLLEFKALGYDTSKF